MERPYIVIDGYPFRFYGVRVKNYSPVLDFLVEKYKVCYFCQTPVKRYALLAEGERQPLDMATIDHLEDRRNRRRHQVVEKVLACYNCNNQRNMEHQKGI